MNLLHDRRTPKCFSLPTSLLDRLEELPKRSQSRWVERVLREKLDQRDTAEELEAR
jgi:metal-responsive CopG/Arc/MetJ family transcriptional regulator